MPETYIERILRARVYDVAEESPLESLRGLDIYFDCGDEDRYGFQTANRRLHEILERLARSSVSGDPEQQPIVQRLRQTILHALPAGDLALEAAARSLGMGGRTLQRRLAEYGTTHKELVRQTRYYLAEQYLRGSDLPIDEIAFLLGYANTPSFTRAFRAWAGVPPSEYRAREVGASG